MALPIAVAPKKVQNGTRKCPHVIPARSKSGFGIYKNHNQNPQLKLILAIIKATVRF